MKKITNLFIAFIAIISLNACSEDDDFTFTAKPDPEGISFTNSTSEVYTLRASNADNLAERFVWNEVNFDVPTPVNYELVGSPSESFESITVLGDVTETNLSVTVGSMLELATEAGLDNDPETEMPNTGTLYFKVRAYVGGDAGNVVEQTSEVLSLTVMLPEADTAEVAKLQIYMVGNASPDGWNNNNNNTPLFRDPSNDNIFYYTGYFAANDVAGQDGEDFAFKFITTLGQWAPMYGPTEDSYATSGSLMFRETEQDTDTGRILVETAGYYSLVLNLEDMTYSFEPVDASTADTYDVIGIVGAGSSVGWPDDATNPTPDIKMTNSEFDKHIWQAKNVVLTNDGIKFRANLSWDVSWGGGENFPSGIATGDNIMAKAGSYSVWFNDISKRYIFIPTPTE